jgi:hypothetical protein
MLFALYLLLLLLLAIPTVSNGDVSMNSDTFGHNQSAAGSNELFSDSQCSGCCFGLSSAFNTISEARTGILCNSSSPEAVYLSCELLNYFFENKNNPLLFSGDSSRLPLFRSFNNLPRNGFPLPRDGFLLSLPKVGFIMSLPELGFINNGITSNLPYNWVNKSKGSSEIQNSFILVFKCEENDGKTGKTFKKFTKN